jgi:ABC-2 type transport system ATP-binding protein
MEPAIKVNKLKKHYGSVKAVKGITFAVERGIIFGMLGPNGAGKTTTIETLVGLIEKTAGKINILGLDPATELEKLQTKIGVQLQSPSLFPRLTVRETAALFASFYPNPLTPETAISQVGLEEKNTASIEDLSGGQKHRLAVALAMISNGDILFLDEPTTGLDPHARRQLWEVILQLKEEGTTIFLTTHYMEEAEKLCDDLAIIDQGQLIAQGAPEELINDHFPQQAVEFSDPGFTETQQKKIAQFASNADYTDNKVLLSTAKVATTITKLLDYSKEINHPIENLTVRKPTLEDVFLKLTGKELTNNV